MNDHPPPPGHLSPASAAWWGELVQAFHFEPHHLRLLQAACEAWDQAQEARALVEREGPTYKDRFGQPKAHPAVDIERKSRDSFRLLLRELALDVIPPNESRAPAAPANSHLRSL